MFQYGIKTVIYNSIGLRFTCDVGRVFYEARAVCCVLITREVV